MRASMSLASHACLKSLRMPARWAVAVVGACVVRRRRRADEASWRHAADCGDSEATHHEISLGDKLFGLEMQIGEYVSTVSMHCHSA